MFDTYLYSLENLEDLVALAILVNLFHREFLMKYEHETWILILKNYWILF